MSRLSSIPPAARQIILDVAKRHRIKPEDLLGEGRAREFSNPRQEAMWLIRNMKTADGLQRFSLPRTGGFFNRHHTAVLSATRAYEARMAVRVAA